MNVILSFKQVNYRTFHREDAAVLLVVHNLFTIPNNKHPARACDQLYIDTEDVLNFSGHTSRFRQVVSYLTVFDAYSHKSRIHPLARGSIGSIIPANDTESHYHYCRHS